MRRPIAPTFGWGGLRSAIGSGSQPRSSTRRFDRGPTRAAEAAVGLARTFRELLGELRAAGKPTTAPANAAVAALQAASGLKQTAPNAWSAAQLEALQAICGIWLEYTDEGAAKAERVLDVAIARSTAASDAWKASAKALLAYSLAAQGRVEDAERHLDEIADAGPAVHRNIGRGARSNRGDGATGPKA